MGSFSMRFSMSMNVTGLLRSACSAALIATLPMVSACHGTADARTAQGAPQPMPAGESWTGVYFHPVYGYLHLVEEGPSIVGRWKRTDQSQWGELSGTFKGNVLHYQWKEHKMGVLGAGATTHGRGTFVYKLDQENRPVLDGEFGLDDEEAGSDWHNVKQQRVAPDLKSVGGDADAVPGLAF